MTVATGVGAEAIGPLDVAIDAKATHRALAAMIAAAATVTKVAVEADGIGGKSDAIVGAMEVAPAMETLMMAGATEITEIGVAEGGVALHRADLAEKQTVLIVAETASLLMVKVEIIKRRPRKTINSSKQKNDWTHQVVLH